MNKHWKLLLGTVLLAGAASAATAAVPAQATAPAAAHQESAAQRASIRHQLARLTEQGATDSQIKSRLGLVRVGQPASSRVITPASRSTVTVSTPKIYLHVAGPSGIKQYYVTAGWKFTGNPDGAGCAIATVTCPIGGEDGFGISFSRQIRNDSGDLFICPTTTRYGQKCFTAVNYATNNAYGAGWKFQDKVRGSNFEHQGLAYFGATRGSLTFDFTPLSKGCLQVFSSYGHSWSSTRLTSIGIGASTSGASVSFGWTRDDHEWDRASDGGRLGC